MRNFFMQLFKKDQNGKNEKEYPYLGLGPTIHLKEFAPYLKMLEGAFVNNYTNIALSGNYGSGKTSVIKTFKEKQKETLKKRNRKK